MAAIDPRCYQLTVLLTIYQRLARRVCAASLVPTTCAGSFGNNRVLGGWEHQALWTKSGVIVDRPGSSELRGIRLAPPKRPPPTHFPNSRSLSRLLSAPFRPIRPGRPTLRATMKPGGTDDRLLSSVTSRSPKNEKYQTNPFSPVTQTKKIPYARPPRTRPTAPLPF